MKHTVVRGAAAVGAAVLGIVQLGRQSLWLDEVMGLEAVRGSWDNLWRFFTGLPEQHPLYYLLLRAWLVFGQSEAALRSLSVVLFVLTVPVVAALATRVVGRREGTVAAWIAATSPFLVYYGQEARMYSLVALLSAGATLAVVRWLMSEDRRWLAGYALLAILGCYTHFFFTFLVVAHFLAAWALKGWRTRQVRQLLGIQVLVAAAYLPWAVFLVTHLGAGQPWKTGVTVVMAVPYTLLRFAVGYGVLPANYQWNEHVPELVAADALPLALAVVGFVAVAVAGAVRLWRSGRTSRIPLVVGIVPVGLGLLVSPITIIASERYYIVIFPLFIILLASGLVELAKAAGSGRIARAAAIAAFIAATGISLWTYYWSPAFGKEQWKAAAQLVRDHQRPDESVVVHPPFALGAFRYYYRPVAGEASLIPNNDPARLPSAERLWLVISHSPNETAYLAKLGPNWQVTLDRRFTHETGIRVLRMERKGD